MSWFNRILGGSLGFLFGGPIGSIVGLAVGHMLDKANEANSSGQSSRFGDFFSSNQATSESLHLAFFTAIFSLLAKVAKADGRISEEEGQHFLHILDEMQLQDELRQFAIFTFNEAKNSSHTHWEFALQLKEIAAKVPMNYGGRGGSALLQQFFYTLVNMAAVDGTISSAEDHLLREIAGAFGFGESMVRQAYSQLRGQDVQIDTAYEVLGLYPSATDVEIRSAYRKLAKETHPDKLIQQGLPPELRASAERRFHEIQNAWEQIRKQRGIS